MLTSLSISKHTAEVREYKGHSHKLLVLGSRQEQI